MSPGVRRTLSARALKQAREALGDTHPDTWAAYGRALESWTKENLARVAPQMPPLSVDFPIGRRLGLLGAMRTALAEAQRATAEDPELPPPPPSDMDTPKETA